MHHSNAFALLDFIFGVIVMGLIGVFGAKMLGNLQTQNQLETLKTYSFLEIYNTLDTIQNYLSEANPDSILVRENSLAWSMQDKNHNITYQNHILYLDGMLLLDEISKFKIYEDTLEISLCKGFKNPFCIEKLLDYR